MTISIVVKFKIKPGMESEYERLGLAVAKTVEANEPGNLMYRIHRTDDPSVFMAIERYTGKAAIDAHSNSLHVQAIRSRLGEMLDGDPEFDMYEEIED